MRSSPEEATLPKLRTRAGNSSQQGSSRMELASSSAPRALVGLSSKGDTFVDDYDAQDSAFLMSSPESFEVVDTTPYMQQNNTCLFSRLPPEICFSIFLNLKEPAEILRASLVSKAWYALATDNVLWKAAFEARPGWHIRSDANELLERREHDKRQKPFPYYLAESATEQRSQWVVRDGIANSTKSLETDFLVSEYTVTLGSDDEEAETNYDVISSDRTYPSSVFSTPSVKLHRDQLLPGEDESPLASRSRSTKTAFERSHLGRVDWRKMYAARHLLERRWLGRCKTYEGDRWLPPYKYLIGHMDAVYCVVADDCIGRGLPARVVSGSRDHTIRIWDISAKRCLSIWKGHTGSVLCIRIWKNLLFSGSSDGHLNVWDYNAMLQAEDDDHTPKADLPIVRRIRHPWSVLDVHVDDKRIVTCCRDHVVRVFSQETFQEILTYKAHQSPVNSGRLNGEQMVTIAGNNSIHIWDINTGKTIRAIHTDEGPACVLFEEGSIIVGTKHPYILVWDAATGLLKHTWRGHEELVRALAYDERKRVIASAGYDGRVKLWRIGESSCLLTLQKHQDQVLDVAMSVSRIFTVGKEQVVCVRDFGSGLDVSLFA